MTPDSRRQFLKSSATAAIAASLSAGGVHANGDSVIKIGLIGCGGRGRGAAINALTVDKQVRLVALADAFEDQVQASLGHFAKSKVADQVDVKPDACFAGFDAYKQVIERCDVVLLCSPPHFRPTHLKAAVDAGKHVFAEKPCAVDAPGVRSVIETCKAADAKKLSIVSGLCLRYDHGFRETVRRIHEGAIGEPVCLQANDYRGSIRVKDRLPEWSEMTWQMRNWYYYTWLSGDFNVEQHVHFLDACAWVMKNEYPVRAIGMGGRQVRTSALQGNIYDHFSIVYEYENGARLFSNTRQQEKCKNDMSAFVIGAKGQSQLSESNKGLWTRGEKEWFWEGPTPGGEMYDNEHAELFASIRAGKPINNGAYMAKSTLLAIMGRMAAYTGQMITWDQALNSKEVLAPEMYAFDAKPPAAEVAMPGRTRFI
jgi:predicted dehydrogenase